MLSVSEDQDLHLFHNGELNLIKMITTVGPTNMRNMKTTFVVVVFLIESSLFSPVLWVSRYFFLFEPSESGQGLTCYRVQV